MSLAPTTVNLPAASCIEEALQTLDKLLYSRWLPAGLCFCPALEDAFEGDTRKRREQHLCLVLAAGMALSYLLIVSDYIFTPYLVRTSLYLRLLPLPLVIFSIMFGTRRSAAFREASASLTLFSFVMVTVAAATLSREPFTQYTYSMPAIACLCANTCVPLRFHWACRFQLLSVIVVAIAMLFFRYPGPTYFSAVLLLNVVPTSFALITNYNFEKTSRRVWLLAAKEARRLADLQQEREQFEMIARTDALTGLANRGHFDRQITSWVASPSHLGKTIWLILLDVDYFKCYNDAYGHPAGDSCLRLIAKILVETTRGLDDLSFRYGGEEFGVLLFDVSDAIAMQAAERIRTTIQQAGFRHANRKDGVDVTTVSLGVGRAVLQSSRTVQELIENADRALYQAKQQGRNRVVAGWNVQPARSNQKRMPLLVLL